MLPFVTIWLHSLKGSRKVLSFERKSSPNLMCTNCFLPRGLSSTSDWLPEHEHSVPAQVLWPIRSQNSGYGALRNSFWWGPRRGCAVLGLHPPIRMLYLALMTSLRIHKTKIHVRNSNRRRFPLKRQNLTALFAPPPSDSNQSGSAASRVVISQ